MNLEYKIKTNNQFLKEFYLFNRVSVTTDFEKTPENKSNLYSFRNVNVACNEKIIPEIVCYYKYA